MSLNQQAITGNREITALLTQVQELNFELHVRDTPISSPSSAPVPTDLTVRLLRPSTRLEPAWSP